MNFCLNENIRDSCHPVMLLGQESTNRFIFCGENKNVLANVHQDFHNTSVRKIHPLNNKYKLHNYLIKNNANVNICHVDILQHLKNIKIN